MTGILLCWTTALLGIDVGWKPLPEGGMEYIIQIEPGMLDALRDGEPIESYLPATIRDVRKYRVVVGKERLPREMPAESPAPAAKPESSSSRTADRPPLNVGALGASPLTMPPALKSNTASAEPPSPLPSSAAAKPLAEKQAVFSEPVANTGGDGKPAAKDTGTPTPDKPWLPLTAVSLALFASLGANVYLGMLLRDARSRCRSLLARSLEPSEY